MKSASVWNRGGHRAGDEAHRGWLLAAGQTASLPLTGLRLMICGGSSGGLPLLTVWSCSSQSRRRRQRWGACRMTGRDVAPGARCGSVSIGMGHTMKRCSMSILGALFSVAVCLVPAGLADESGHTIPVVIDTDMGLDDSVAMAIALQHPLLDVSGLVVTAGAMSADGACTFAERMLYRFNRGDVALYGAARPGKALTGAELYVLGALSDEVPARHQGFSPDAYRVRHGKTTVIALGAADELGRCASRTAGSQVAHWIDRCARACGRGAELEFAG